MTSLDEYHLMLEKVTSVESTETVSLLKSTGRVLAEDIIADIDQPPFNKSAMDGYACRRADLPGPFVLVGEIAAGKFVEDKLLPGTCYRIFTGAPVPEGADCVIMQEHVSVNSEGAIHFTQELSKNNICYQGEDVKAGEIVLNSGTLIKAHHIAVMAGFGRTKVEVNKKPLISILCSGSELVEPSVLPPKAKIRNSNAYQLLSQFEQSGFQAQYLGIVADNKEDLFQCLNSAVKNSDLLVVTGGASVGDYDLLPEILLLMGAKIHFSGLNIQPGKPVLWASVGSVHIVGLSGNPVSSYIQFLLVVKPLLYRICNSAASFLKVATIPISTSLKTKKGNRKQFYPIRLLADGRATPLPFNGSAHINALIDADGFAIFEPGTDEISENQLVNIIIFE